MRRSKERGKITPDEWNNFLRGSNTDYTHEKFEEDWLDDSTWHKILGFEECSYNYKDPKKSFKNPEHL